MTETVEFQLSEEHRMIQGMVREFASREILPRAAVLDRTGEYPADIIRSASALGLMGMMVPEAYGGAHLVGVKGTVVIAHGSSTRRAIANALTMAGEGAERDLVGRIEAGLRG